MYDADCMYMVIRCATIFEVACGVYIVKTIISGLSKLIKLSTKDIVEVVEKLEEDMEKQQTPTQT